MRSDNLEKYYKCLFLYDSVLTNSFRYFQSEYKGKVEKAIHGEHKILDFHRFRSCLTVEFDVIHSLLSLSYFLHNSGIKSFLRLVEREVWLCFRCLPVWLISLSWWLSSTAVLSSVSCMAKQNAPLSCGLCSKSMNLPIDSIRW